MAKKLKQKQNQKHIYTLPSTGVTLSAYLHLPMSFPFHRVVIMCLVVTILKIKRIIHFAIPRCMLMSVFPSDYG